MGHGNGLPILELSANPLEYLEFTLPDSPDFFTLPPEDDYRFSVKNLVLVDRGIRSSGEKMQSSRLRGLRSLLREDWIKSAPTNVLVEQLLLRVCDVERLILRAAVGPSEDRLEDLDGTGDGEGDALEGLWGMIGSWFARIKVLVVDLPVWECELLSDVYQPPGYLVRRLSFLCIVGDRY